MPSSNRFNTVVIVNSIPDGEMNTARRLLDDLRDISNVFSPVPRIKYCRVESADDLASTLDAICVRVRNKEIHPLIHIEAHGDENGLKLALEERVDWTHLKEMLTPLNVAMGLDLLLVLAACQGGAFVKPIRLSDRAPVWGLIGPTRELSADRVQTDFGAFYKAVFKSLSPSEAIKSLNANAPAGLYYGITAEGLFYKVWNQYKDEFCTKEQLRIRSIQMYRHLKNEGVDPSASVGQLRRRIVSRSQPYSTNFGISILCMTYSQNTPLGFRLLIKLQRARRALADTCREALQYNKYR